MLKKIRLTTSKNPVIYSNTQITHYKAFLVALL